MTDITPQGLLAHMPKQIWIMPSRDQWERGTGDWMAEFWGLPSEPPYILATPEVLADLPAVRALVEAAVAAERERCMRIAASLFPGGYDNNFAKITAAIRQGETT